jgi:hypothetical protein
MCEACVQSTISPFKKDIFEDTISKQLKKVKREVQASIYILENMTVTVGISPCNCFLLPCLSSPVLLFYS